MGRGAADHVGIAAVRQEDHRDRREVGVVVDAAEQRQPGSLGEADVQQHQIGSAFAEVLPRPAGVGEAADPESLRLEGDAQGVPQQRILVHMDHGGHDTTPASGACVRAAPPRCPPA
jgi:hypothetical protein